MSLPPHRRLSGENLLFAILLVLHLIPLWAFTFFPTQDGPGHQAVALILRQYELPEAGGLREYFALNREALPNSFIFFLMTRVLAFLSVPGAEKVLLSVYVVLLPLAARYALRAVDPRAGFLAVLSFPFVYNYTLHMGFFNFCFSLPAFFFAVGYGLKHIGKMTPGRSIVLALLVLWVYFCHPVTLVLTVAALLTLAGWRFLLEWRETRRLWEGIRTWLPGLVLACLPALLLMAAFVGRRMGAKTAFLPLSVKVKHLAGLYSLASLNRWTPFLAAALALLFYGLLLLCLRQRGRRPLEVRDGLLLMAGVFGLAYFLAPSELSGGGFIVHRLNLFPFLALLLWFGAFEHSEGRRRWIQGVAVGFALGFLGLFAWSYAVLNRGLKEIAEAGERMEPDRTFLYLSYAHQGEGPDGEPLAFRVSPFVHAGGILAAEKRLVDLSLYEANEDYFPVYYRPQRNPFRHLSVGPLGIEAVPPKVEILTYPGRTGGRVDYVVLWGLREERKSQPEVRKVLDQLAAGYEEFWVSRDGGVRLYRIRAG